MEHTGVPPCQKTATSHPTSVIIGCMTKSVSSGTLRMRFHLRDHLSVFESVYVTGAMSEMYPYSANTSRISYSTFLFWGTLTSWMNTSGPPIGLDLTGVIVWS